MLYPPPSAPGVGAVLMGLMWSREAVLMRHYYGSEHTQVSHAGVSHTVAIGTSQTNESESGDFEREGTGHLLLAVGPLGASAPKRAP